MRKKDSEEARGTFLRVHGQIDSGPDSRVKQKNTGSSCQKPNKPCKPETSTGHLHLNSPQSPPRAGFSFYLQTLPLLYSL